MKKSFDLIDPKIHSDRLVESVKFKVRKYLKRERAKALPDDVDYWDFDCRFGPTIEEAQKVHVAELPKCIELARASDAAACYIEIIAKPGVRLKRPKELAE